ncbi:MAG: hypothetical protein ABIH67_04555 [Candidatus Uhrbacteria bacterium]
MTNWNQDAEILTLLHNGQKAEIKKLNIQEGWNFTEEEIDRMLKNDTTREGLVAIEDFFEILNCVITSHLTGVDVSLVKDRARDEFKIFLLVSLFNSLIKLDNLKLWPSKVGEALHTFFNRHFTREDKKKVENNIDIQISADSEPRPITFCEFADILYKIRCNFTHEGEYICQFFKHSADAPAYQYRNVKKLNDVEKIITNFTFTEFKRMSSNAIKNWLISGYNIKK